MKKTTKFDVIAIGGATRDILFYSKEGELISTGNMTKQKLLAFEYGAKISADRIYFDCGGGASNAAVSFAKLGLKSAIVCRVGHDDNGLAIIKNFKENKVDTTLVKVDAKVNTGFSVILTVNNEAKEHVAFLYRGANDELSKKDLSAGKLNADWFYVTSLPKDNWEEIMDEVVKSKKNIVWNPGAKQLAELPKLKKYLPHIKIFMVNHEEAMEFRKLKDIKGLLTHIFSLGPKLVVITDGKRGAYAYDGKKYYFIRAKSTKAVNTIGVGDAFGSALTSAFICGKNIKESLEWGIKNSASVVGHIGAQKGLLNSKQIGR
ncbi:MAG: carbohydrate kinase family protein [Patescibacteria group bacterium]|jgi:ribokinase